MAVDMSVLLNDLKSESDELLQLLDSIDITDWSAQTPAVGWLVRDQISHLAYFDQAATLAATDPDRFRVESSKLLELGDGFPDEVAHTFHEMAPQDLLTWFKEARQELIETFSVTDPRERLPWYGPEMSAASSATARFMETWAHGQDVYDALGRERVVTNRIRHVAHLGVSTFGFTHSIRGLEVPTAKVSVTLTAPDGDLWTWGEESAGESVKGSAYDFCLVVTQRRAVADTELEITGDIAARWMSIAQAYAGAPGPGRAANPERQ